MAKKQLSEKERVFFKETEEVLKNVEPPMAPHMEHPAADDQGTPDEPVKDEPVKEPVRDTKDK